MRFLPDGPPLPDELLVARDEGRVIFFCGAGVSRARAGLSDFLGLAQQVIDHLGVSSDSPARLLVEIARKAISNTGLHGLISADRIFGLLEREFLVEDIQVAVAKALKPNVDADLSAHRILLDLAKWPDGKIRIVTTNFDRLFQACDSSLRFWRPPNLPSPIDYETFEGIIHLHGCVDENYTGADGEGFILSSPEFGRAYLSDGWATKFIQAILSRYFVVFVGYTADDPPVQYLLEALNRSVESRQGVYAFQSGTSGEAQAKWLHKGVQPIAYDEGDNHRALWNTLEAWAGRARDPDVWYENVISLAQQGPEALLPHARGQIAHVVSTLEGVKKFSASTNPPPAEWLCVFDSSIRYAKPGFAWNSNGQGPYFDPFAAYGLDSDPIPLKIDPDDYYAKRELPENVWDCFAATRMDRQNLGDDNFPALRGYWATHVPRLPPRLARLGIWIAKVSNQPTTVWWLAGHTSLHPDIQFDLRLRFDRDQTTYSREMRLAWRYLFEILETPKARVDYRLFELKSSAKVDGWSNALIRRLVYLHQPRLIAKRPWSRPKPPNLVAEFTMRDILEVEVDYPRIPHDLQIPDEHLEALIRELRKNLERAVSLEKELGGAGLTLLVPIESDPDLQGTTFGRGYKISGAFLFYVSLFKKLIDKDATAAKQECLAWPSDDDAVFTALRIWVSGENRVFSAEEAANILCQLDDDAFWYSRHQRDLLLAMAKRWSGFSENLKTKVGSRLLEGPARWNDEELQEYTERRAWSSLNRIHWLHANGCEFSFDIVAETIRLRQLAPTWQPEYAQKAGDSMEGRGGMVRTDTEYEPLIKVPLGQLLNKAEEISGRTSEILVERKPFAGLACTRPIRALSALTTYGRRGEYPKWAWKTFLNPEARKADKPKLSALIAERVSRLPRTILAENIHSVCDWLLTSSCNLFRGFPAQLDRVWAAIGFVLKSDVEVAKSSIRRGTKEQDWPLEALNAPVGKLAQVLLSDPRKDNLPNEAGFWAGWVGRINELLSLEGDLRRHALVMFAHHVDWFFMRDAAWTEENLLSALTGVPDDQNAFWSGFLWAGRIPHRNLFYRLKPTLLSLAKSKALKDSQYREVLAGIVFAGWKSRDPATDKRYVTDSEMRDLLLSTDDQFRSHLLWRLGNSSDDDEIKDLRDMEVSVFLSKVWPLQKSVKTPRMTARLCDLAFSDSTLFPKRVDEILPLVTKIDETARNELVRLENETIKQHPEKTLALLSAILPENPSIWPYGIEDALNTIGVSQPALRNDSRLIELDRRWNAR